MNMNLIGIIKCLSGIIKFYIRYSLGFYWVGPYRFFFDNKNIKG